MNCTSHTLSNGLRIVHLQTDSHVAYCGFAVNVGTRDEKQNESGFAHFVEHMLFKGTSKRKAWHIINRMESVGGELNAYTSKEETVVYSIFMEKDFERAAELMSDLLVNSKFPENEIAKERGVILEEIQSYKDNPSELIFDDFENVLFKKHSLGHHILGNKRSLMQFDTHAGRSFTERFYTSDNMVFFSMSKTDFRKILQIAEKYLCAIPVQKPAIRRQKPEKMVAQELHKKKKTHMAHIITGGYAYDLHDANRYPLFLLNNIIGGPGMNSRLNVSLREKHGLVYNVESNITSYTDTGVFSIYLGTDKSHRKKALELVERELSALRDKKLSVKQLSAAKKQAIGQFCVAKDNKESVFLGLGKAFLHYNRYESMTEIIHKIEAITAEDVLDTANHILHPDKLFLLVYE